jgi:carnitine O-acetyltransferase
LSLTRATMSTHSKPQSLKTFALQEKLPKLPIPKLEETIPRYLKSIEPITTPQEYKKVVEKANSFLKNEGPQLQSRLESYARHQKVNPISSHLLSV